MITMRGFFLVFLFVLTSSNVKSDNWMPSSDTLNIINEQIKQNIPTLAIEYLPKVLNYMDVNEDEFIDTAYVLISVELAGAYQMKGDMVSSDNVLDNASYALDKRGINKTFTEFDLIKGMRDFLLGNFNKAIKHLIKVKNSENNSFRSSGYLSLLSGIISCYNSLNNTTEGNKFINEALELIKLYEHDYSSLSKVQVLSNSGAFLMEQGEVQRGIQLIQKAYNIASKDSSCDGFLNRIAVNLGTYYLNSEDYDKAICYFKEVKENHLNDNEKDNLQNAMFLLNYYLGNELETCKFASEHSKNIRKKLSNLFQHFSILSFDNNWDKYCIQLSVNMGALHKFKDNELLNTMCYDNALFTKNIVYWAKANYREYIKTHPEALRISNQAKGIRQSLLFLNADDSVANDYKDSIANIEEIILKKLDNTRNATCYTVSCEDIKQVLKEDECAIEIISSVGFYNTKDNPSLKLGALIITHDSNYPIYVELCENEQMYNAILESYKNEEIGINSLYLFDGEYTLYNLLWKNIEPYIKKIKKINVATLLNTQNVNWGFIPCPDGKYLNDKYEIHHLSSTASLLNKNPIQINSVAIFGDINYENEHKNSCNSKLRGLIEEYDSTRGNFQSLTYTKEEIDSIQYILSEININTSVFSREAANEMAFRSLDGNSPSIIHIASHAYNLVGFNKFDDYFNRLTPLIQRDKTMIRTGLLFNGANHTLNSHIRNDGITDGVITAEEISAMDLSNTDIVVISACESLLGTSTEGFGGLPKAFKQAGVRHILGSLWKVSDSITSLLMKEFYKNIKNGIDVNSSLILAQYSIKEQYPDPYYWAAFVLLD